MSNINFTCPHCSFSKQLPASAEGRQGNCPSCNAVVTITATAPPSPSASPQQPLPPQTSQSRDRSGNRNKLVLAASAVVIVVLCISGSLLFYFSPQGGVSIPLISDQTDFDATGEKIFNALSERSTAKLQSYIFSNVVLNKIRAEIREGVPESLQAAYDEKNTRTNDLNRYSDRDMAEYNSYFVGFFSDAETSHPQLKSQWENIEYIGIIGRNKSDRFIDSFKHNFDYSGAYDPDTVIAPSVFFKLDNEIYCLIIGELLREFDGKWYATGDRTPRIIKFTKENIPNLPVDEMGSVMYGGTEKVLIRLIKEFEL
jgi:hypothetical protein